MDLFNDDQQETRAVPPVSAEDDAKNNRRRRSERYAEETNAEEQQVKAAQEEAKEAPAQENRPRSRIPAPPNPEIISQGIPRPAALSGQRPHREQAEQQEAPSLRRPVQAEGYAPLQQLGSVSRRPVPPSTIPVDEDWEQHSMRPTMRADGTVRRENVRRPVRESGDSQSSMRADGTVRRDAVRRPSRDVDEYRPSRPSRHPDQQVKRETVQQPMAAVPARPVREPVAPRAPMQADGTVRSAENCRPVQSAAPQQTAVQRPVRQQNYAAPQQAENTSRVRRPEMPYPARGEEPRRPRNPQTEQVGYEIIQQEEEKGTGRGLIAVIIALLAVAAIIIGLIMIPEDQPGFLGNIKRAVTEPVKSLFGGSDEQDETLPATAADFTATISQATAPYKVVFHMVTSGGVTQVRVVDAEGAVIPTMTTLSTPSSENTVIWMFELVTEDRYSGQVQAQIQSGDSWVNTGLFQTLELGGASATVSAGPMTYMETAAPSATPTATPIPTATPTAAPTEVQQTMVPVVVLTPNPTDEPAQVVETPVVTATPTLAATATPTLVPTAAPTEAPTPEPTAEPTAEPTPEPTATPAPTPVVTPKLEAAAHEKADPSLITETEVYKDGRKTKDYVRKEPMNMPPAEDYLLRDFGVTTFRGSAFRQNAATDTVENPTGLSLAWTVEAGSAAGSSRNYYGIGWTGQPVIVKWAADIRKSMNLDETRKEQKNLKEVILAGMDGKIYFLDLQDGTATREAINFGYPMRSTPSLNPLFFPSMTVGQYARKMKSGTTSNIGLYYYDLTSSKQLRMIDGIDRKLKRPYSENASGAFDTSALIDRSTNTLIAIGTNGLLYTEKLDMSMRVDQETGKLQFVFDEPTETVSMMSHARKQREAGVAVESSLAMYGSYAYYADMDGILRCVDTTTMTTVWAVDTGDSVRAAIALDLVEDGDTNTLWLYTANLINTARTKGDVTIRRFNAMTGEEDWAYAVNCAKGKKKDVTFNKEVIPGAMASPVIGQNGLSDLVYFTISSVSDKGGKALGEAGALSSVIVALNKESGELVWHKPMEAYSYSSPVAVYDESGNGWIIQACANGQITLMDGLTGEVINTLQVNGVIEGSPAVYGDMMVIGTTGKGTSYIYGIQIK